MCRGTDAGGGAELHSMWSPIHNASEYTEEHASEMHQKSMEFDVQGHTLTSSQSSPLLVGEGSICVDCEEFRVVFIFSYKLSVIV